MTRTCAALLAALMTMLVTRPAAADLLLSFDPTTYTIAGVGNTTEVKVLLSQVPGGPQVGPTNELLSAGITLSFATTGAATVLSESDVTAGPDWFSTKVIRSPGDPNTLVELGLLSLSSISDLSSPLLLGTFKFTAQSEGATTISVASLSPGSSFITSGGNILDPTNTANAQITVTSSTPVVPEPSSLFIVSAAALTAAVVARRRRRRAGA